MMTSSSFLFMLGGFTFLFAFSWFKDAAMEVFKKEFASNDDYTVVWSKRLKVFLVDWLVCVLGALGTGALFVVVLNLAY